MAEARCKMSVFIEEYDEEANYCGLATLVKCEGCKYIMNGCCLFWGRPINPKEEKECTAKEVL